ncbi:hypothetical protein ES703_60910 [subsurface metagenome]
MIHPAQQPDPIRKGETERTIFTMNDHTPVPRALQAQNVPLPDESRKEASLNTRIRQFPKKISGHIGSSLSKNNLPPSSTRSKKNFIFFSIDILTLTNVKQGNSKNPF